MRIRPIVSALLLSVLIPACTPVGGAPPSRSTAPEPESGPTFPRVGGEWTGSITVEGQQIAGTLSVVQDGPDLEGVFDAEAFGLVGRGSGTVLPDGTVQIALVYDLQCPGTATMTGDLSSDGSGLSGTLLANDCTGDVSGSFRFSR